MDVPLIELGRGTDDDGAKSDLFDQNAPDAASPEFGCAASCRACVRTSTASCMSELKENWIKVFLVIATIVMSTFTAFTINNLATQNEILQMRLEAARTLPFCLLLS